MTATFQLASGGIIGRDHREIPRNYQDGASITHGRTCTVAVVTDGCSGGAHSEVGAQIGARLLSQSIAAECDRQGIAGLNWQRIQQDVLAFLHMIASNMGGIYGQAVNDYCLFTIVGVMITDDLAEFFALGDGVLLINGNAVPLGPFPNNEPPYLGYALVGSRLTALDPQALAIKSVARCAVDDLEHFLIGTDGVLDLVKAARQNLPGLDAPVGLIDQFWQDDRYFAPGAMSPDGSNVFITRRLKLIARDYPRRSPEPGLLHDDTTLVVGRKYSPIHDKKDMP